MAIIGRVSVAQCANGMMPMEVKRSSNIELLRCVAMLLIVAWHWFIYTGTIEEAYAHPEQPVNWLRFALCGWGKTGINCFVLITGYFLWKHGKPFGRKILNLLLLVLGYSILTYGVGCALGAITPSWRGVIGAVNPFACTRGTFVPNYLLLLVVAPFLNILIAAMGRRRHLLLLITLVILCSVIPMGRVRIVSDTLAWFVTVYFVGAFLAKYPIRILDEKRNTIMLLLAVLVMAFASMVVGTMLTRSNELRLTYYLIFPETRPLSLAVALSLFLFFKNIDIPYSSVINRIGLSTFGIYLISDGWLREWIWAETAGLRGGGVILVFMFCSIVEMVRHGVLERFIKHEKSICDRR